MNSFNGDAFHGLKIDYISLLISNEKHVSDTLHQLKPYFTI